MNNMPDFDAILRQSRQLSPADRRRLARVLSEESGSQDEADEADAGVGERGLAAWTESARGEDWSEFYPVELRQRKVG